MPTTEEIAEIARVCHEANRAWCIALGDYSQDEWHEAPEWLRDSTIKGVVFALNHPNASEGALHEAWMADKIAHGWSHGPVKDTEAKTHPNLVPFDQLPAHQQAKDRMFKAIVAALSPGEHGCFETRLNDLLAHHFQTDGSTRTELRDEAITVLDIKLAALREEETDAEEDDAHQDTAA